MDDGGCVMCDTTNEFMMLSFVYSFASQLI